MGPSCLNGIILWQIMQSLLIVYSIKWNNALWHKLCRIKQAHQQDFMNLWIKENTMNILQILFEIHTLTDLWEITTYTVSSLQETSKSDYM